MTSLAYFGLRMMDELVEQLTSSPRALSMFSLKVQSSHSTSFVSS